MGRFSNRCTTRHDFGKMKYFFFLLLILFNCASAHADYTPKIQYMLLPAYTGQVLSSKQAVCDAAIQYLNQTVYSTDPIKSNALCQDNTGQYSVDSTSANYEITASYVRQSGAGTIYHRVGYVFQRCFTGDTRLGNIVPNVLCSGTPPDCSDGKVADEAIYYIPPFSKLPSISCHNGCETLLVTSEPPYMNCAVATGGFGLCQHYQRGKYVNDGNTCNGSPAEVKKSPEAVPNPSCPVCDCLNKGKSWGTVSGSVVCVPMGSTGSNPVTKEKDPTVTKNTPAPTPETPNPKEITEVKGGGGSITTTPAPAGSPEGTQPTITENTTNPDGSSTSTSQTEEGYCSKNPTSPSCQQKTDCDKFPDSVGCKKSDDFIDNFIDSIKEKIIGTENDIPNESLEQKEITIGENTNFQTVQINSDSSCPSPRTMTIAGATMEVSFEWLCQYASAFRMLVRALATFFAFQIIAAAIRGDAQPHQRSLF